MARKATLACALAVLGAALFAPNGPPAHAASPWPQTQLAYCGSQAGGWMATALSADGSTALVGARLQNDTNTALVYSWNGTGWGLPTALLPPGGSGPNYALAVGLSANGSTALVGDWGKGQLFAFVRVAGVWTLQAAITSSLGPDWAERLSVSADGNTVVATAPDYEGSTGPTGYAAVVTRQGSTWSQPVPIVTAAHVWSTAVSGDGSTIIVGYNDSAHVFQRSGASWTDTATLTGDPSKSGFGSGTALDQSGHVALVTAVDSANLSGQGYVFQLGSSGWSQPTMITPSDLTSGAQYGANSDALSSDGSVALIAAEGQASYDGAAYLWSGGPAGWTQVQKLTAPGPNVEIESYGTDVALSGDGATGLIAGVAGAVAAGARAGIADQCPVTDGRGGFGPTAAAKPKATVAPSTPPPATATPSPSPSATDTPLPTDTPAPQVTPAAAHTATPPSGPSALWLLPLALAMGGGAYVGRRRWQHRRHPVA